MMVASDFAEAGGLGGGEVGGAEEADADFALGAADADGGARSDRHVGAAVRTVDVGGGYQLYLNSNCILASGRGR